MAPGLPNFGAPFYLRFYIFDPRSPAMHLATYVLYRMTFLKRFLQVGPFWTKTGHTLLHGGSPLRVQGGPEFNSVGIKKCDRPSASSVPV